MKNLFFATIFFSFGLQLQAQPVSETQGTGVFVVFKEFNPGKSEEWDGELEFQISYGITRYDSVKRNWSNEQIGKSDEFVIKEGKIDSKVRSLIVSTKDIEAHFVPAEVAKAESLFRLSLVDVGFFGDAELVQNEFNFGLLPFTKPIRASVADLPRTGRDAPTFAEVIVTIQRKTTLDRLEQLVPKNSIRWHAEQAWAGADKDYILYAVHMAALYQILETYQIPASTVIVDEKALKKMNDLFEEIHKGAVNQQLGEGFRRMHRMKGFGLGAAKVLSFFGIINPEDVPSTAEVVIDKVKLLAVAEGHAALAKFHYYRADGAGEDLKGKLLDLEKPAFKDRAKDLYAKAKGKLGDLAKATKEKVFRRDNQLLPESEEVPVGPEKK